MVSLGRVCLLPEFVSVYRKTGEGISTSLSRLENLQGYTALHFDMFLHGPLMQRSYFAGVVLGSVAGFITTNRSRPPVVISVKDLIDLLRAHRFVSKNVEEFIPDTIARRVEYVASVCFYLLRVLAVKFGLKFLWRNRHA